MSLKLLILKLLARVPSGVPLTALRTELEQETGGPVGDGDLEQALTELKQKGMVSEWKLAVTDSRCLGIPAPEQKKKKGKGRKA